MFNVFVFVLCFSDVFIAFWFGEVVCVVFWFRCVLVFCIRLIKCVFCVYFSTCVFGCFSVLIDFLCLMLFKCFVFFAGVLISSCVVVFFAFCLLRSLCFGVLVQCMACVFSMIFDFG